MKKSRIRSRLNATQILLIISALSIFGVSGCVNKGTQRVDTGQNAPPNIVEEVTIVCSTAPTISTLTASVSTSTQTTSTTSTMMPITTSAGIVLTEMMKEIEKVSSETTAIESEEKSNVELIGESFDYGLPITEQDFVLLANVVSHEAGSSWISEYERACIVASVMNRVYDSRFPNTIDSVVHQPGQMFDVPYYRIDYSGIGYEPIDNAIYAYFNGVYECGNINSWTGNGTNNRFYYQ